MLVFVVHGSRRAALTCGCMRSYASVFCGAARKFVSSAAYMHANYIAMFKAVAFVCLAGYRKFCTAALIFYKADRLLECSCNRQEDRGNAEPL